jgi:glycerol transport system substrate-binding protein
VNSGAFTPQEAMDRLAAGDGHRHGPHAAADEKANVYGGCGPRLNEERDAEYWLSQPGAPKAKLANEKPQGETVNYDELVARWQQ